MSIIDINKILKELALRSTCRKKFGVLLMYKGKIVGKGYNYQVGNFSIHAEEDAINNIKNRKLLGKCELLLARYMDGQFVNCKCCPRCQKRIMSAGIRQINVLET